MFIYIPLHIGRKTATKLKVITMIEIFNVAAGDSATWSLLLMFSIFSKKKMISFYMSDIPTIDFNDYNNGSGKF